MLALVLLGTSSPASAAGPQTLDDHPHGSYVWVPESVSQGVDPVAAGEPHILYLNRCVGGITITSGWPDDNTINRSGILNGTTTFPEFSYGESAWQQVMEETRAIFSPFNITVTDVDPSPAPHDEAIVCGSGGTAGFSGAGGVAPFTCDVIPSPITFTFPDSLGGNPRIIAEVIGQEAAHAWGLEHEYKCEDPMSYLNGCGEKTYQDGDYPCGEYSAASCDCGGATQNSYQYILNLFGAAVDDLAAPVAVITAPSDGDVFAAGASFELTVDVSDDIGVTYVALYLDGAVATEAVAAPYGPWPVFDLPEGAHDFYVEARDAAGNTTTSPVVSVNITVDGMPPAGADDGGEEGGEDGGDDDDGDGGGGGEGADDDGDGGGNAAGGAAALPWDYGADADEGCSCSASKSSMGGLAAGPFLLLLGLVGVRGRARTSVHAAH